MKHNYVLMGKTPVNVVIETGLGACIGEWLPLAKKLAADYGILLYERAGINKSEPSTNPRTPRHIADELFELLQSIPHEEKVILLAHSQGGLYAQQFCRLYPQMVRGIVLLDPLSANDNQFREKLSAEEYKRSGVDKSSNFQLMYKFAKWRLGFISKMLLRKAPPFYYYKGFEPSEADDILGCTKSPLHAQTALNEYNEAHKPENTKLLTEKNDFPDIPLILVTHSSPLAIQENMEFGNNTRDFAEKIEDMWQEIMKEYLGFSTKSVWYKAEQSTHYIHLTEPELVIRVLEEISK